MQSIENHILNIQQNGFTIIQNGIDIHLVDKVVNDFDYWSALNENGFVKFNQDRVVNFHMYSENTKNLVTNNVVNDILKTIFNKEQAIYTSLFFREGTSQNYHRDTPHFYTNPIDQYYGVWYALEDVNINAGPLKYYIGSHNLEDPRGYDIFNNVSNSYNADYNIFDRCLFEYNKLIEDLCKENNLLCVDQNNYINKINKGDIIIWHPKLLHGGSDIIDTMLTRYSMVTHNIPINTQVFNAAHFFAPIPTKNYLDNKCAFHYIKHNNINIVNHYSEPHVQKGYL
jgi:hypothetical protein